MVGSPASALGVATALALLGCAPEAGPAPGPIDPAEEAQARYAEWIETSPISPARALARVPLGATLTIGPDSGDIPLEGDAEFLLHPGEGFATLEGEGERRTVAPYRPVTIGEYSLSVQGERGSSIVMIYAPKDTQADSWGYYPIDPSMVFEVQLRREKPVATRMLAVDGVEVEGYRVGTVTLPMGPEGATLEVRSVPDLATEETNFEIYFRDQTNGAGSYPAGRFVTLLPLGEDRYQLDFNRSRGPFCAYSTAYPCPVPWRGNTIAMPIEAGERYGGTDDPPPLEE